jgi:hypothetical protein
MIPLDQDSARRLAIVAGIVCVTGVSLAPFHMKAFLYPTGIVHDVKHLVVFAVTAAMLCPKAVSFRKAAVLAFAVWGFGAVLEIAQWRIYNNAFE